MMGYSPCNEPWVRWSALEMTSWILPLLIVCKILRALTRRDICRQLFRQIQSVLASDEKASCCLDALGLVGSLRTTRTNRYHNRITRRKSVRTTLDEHRPNQHLWETQFMTLFERKTKCICRKRRTLFSLEGDFEISAPVADGKSFGRLHGLWNNRLTKFFWV